MKSEYNSSDIEKKWQETWEKEGIYKVGDSVPGKDNFYALVEFTYPSGNLHVGHWYAFAVPDIIARYKRMKGFNVLYPMGFDAFGLPAENAAIKFGGNPKDWTYKQMETMRGQFKTMGAMFPWEKEVVSCSPSYYKWTQWMFNQFLKNDLVYRDTTMVNWCPKDKTILANEQVTDGKCERCGSEVEQKSQEQWMIRITKYADRLIDDLDKLPWPNQIKASQKAWIGRSEGSEISFALKEAEMVDINTGPLEDAYRPGEDIKERNNVVVIIEHPDKEDYLCARWKKVDWQGFVTGGIEEGKTAEETALEEVREETGYQNVKLVKVYDRSSHGLFWHVVKNENRKAHYKIVHVKLENLDRNEPSDEEKEIAEFVWVPKGEVNSFLKREDMRYPWRVVNGEDTLGVADVFTTRADTLFGVTYIVLAPEHPLVGTLRDRIQNWSSVEAYIQDTKKKSELDRQQSKEKTGVRLEGIVAINPANGEEVPVWVADYVLAGYGTGAVMAVPAHDERDFEFANKYNLPIKQVISPENSFRAIVVAPTLENEAEFKEKLLENEINFTLSVSTISKREHIRVELNSEEIEKFITLVQQYIKEGNWVEILGTQNILVLKKEVHKDFVDNIDHWFAKFQEWEPFVKGQKSFWDMIGKNPFLSPYICYSGNGIVKNSISWMNGLLNEDAIEEIVGHLEHEGLAKKVKTYRLRDWGISRQRYWGCPIPVVYDPQGVAHAVPDEHLPWLLPEDVDHTPDGTAPLARSRELFERTEKIFGKGWTPEVETMDTFVDSTWYFYRYLDNQNDAIFASDKRLDSWMPIDLYMGGPEHTTMHLLYSRFWTKALFDLGLVKDDEAFKVRINRGLILGSDGNKMSKSKGNFISPDEIVDRLGADTVRMYLCFMGPYGVTVNYPWDPNGVVGVRRFLERVWRIQEIVGDTGSPDSIVLFNQTIKGISEDMEEFKFNTAISKMMILINAWEKEGVVAKEQYRTLLLLLAPFAPHMTEEIWRNTFGEKESIHLSVWPTFDPTQIQSSTITMVVQVNGKVRAKIELPLGLTEEEVMTIAKERSDVAKWLTGEPAKVIHIKDKLLNIVL